MFDKDTMRPGDAFFRVKYGKPWTPCFIEPSEVEAFIFVWIEEDEGSRWRIYRHHKTALRYRQIVSDGGG